MIFNYTNHNLTVFGAVDVTKDRYTQRLKLIRPIEQTKPLLEVPKAWPLNVYDMQGWNTEISENGVAFRAAPPYSETIDTIDVSKFGPDDIGVVSSKYAEAAKIKLPHYIVDRLFVPAGLVRDCEGKVVGCTALAKVAAFQVPSYYLTFAADSITKKLAIEHWKLNKQFLSPNEIEALRNLELIVTYGCQNK